jgi:hypothetical protein
VRQAERTFIGFAEGQSLDDFEATASEAQHVLRAVRSQLCRLDQQRDNGLRTASLESTGLQITAVRFMLADLSAADVEVKAGAQDPIQAQAKAGETVWNVRMQRSGPAWRVLSSRKK